MADLAGALAGIPDPVRHRVIDDAAGLVRIAAGANPDRFSRAAQQAITRAYDQEGTERLGRRRSRACLRRGVDPTTGMYWLRAELDPERGAVLFGRLDAEREALFHSGAGAGHTREQVELHALLNLASTTGDAQASSRGKVHASIIVDIETLAIGAHDRLICESSAGQPLPAEVARALVCAATLSYGLTIEGRVVHHVANAALATTDQRRELRMMHRTCVGPGCDVPSEHCPVHHVVPRSRDGPTATPLLVPLCKRHHRDVHHAGWVLEIDGRRHVTWTAPDGTRHDVPFCGLAGTKPATLFPPDPGAAA